MDVKGLFDLREEVAVVTGAGSGLGVALAEALAEAGADVVCADLNEKTANETAEKINKLGCKGLALAIDVSKEQDVRRMREEAVKEFGKIDILINNAGIAGSFFPAHELPAENWDEVININLRGVFLCAKEVLNVMVEQGRGKIINIASIWGLVGSIFPIAHYAAAKGGVVNLTKQLALEYAEHEIHVNCIAPGFFGPTNLAGGLMLLKDSEIEETLTPLVPMKRIAHPNELKGIAVFLASKASDFVTGQTIAIEGGFLAK
jgi:NAD(P)-dependent dehydrogenase (short-subunit alcohol dehydrogenase family)